MSKYPKTLVTPREIKLPYAGIVVDCGLTLVHGLDGTPRNYLHQISIIDDPEVVNVVRRDGYELFCGHTIKGEQLYHFSKRFPLSVAAWSKPVSC